MIGTLRSLASSMAFRFVLAGIVVVAGVFVGIELTSGGSTYQIKAVYSSAPGLFPGAAVDVLGVKVGTVTAVKNVHAIPRMLSWAVDSKTKMAPAKAVASLVAPQLLGQPDVDPNPGYTGGATFCSAGLHHS